MSIPKTCKAAMFEQANGGLIIKEVPVPTPEPGEVLLKILGCGVCHSDSVVGAGMFGPLPRIPGHEFIGDVVAVGSEVKKWQVGDRLGGPWHGGHDGTCRQCNRGVFQMCANGQINGVTRHGGYSEYATLRSEAAVRISKDLDPLEAAPLLCAGVTVFNSIRHMGTKPGDTVAIQGLGGLGHLAVQYSSKMGYRTVALSTSDKKKDFAKKLGAHDYVDGSKEDTVEQLQKMGGADLIVVTAPNPDLIKKLVGGVAPGGTLLVLAPVGEFSVDSIPLITKGISVRGWPSGHSLDSEEAIAFAGTHGVHCMVEKFPLDKANEALKHMESGNVRFRAVLQIA